MITKALVLALIMAESSGNPAAMSSKGACGLTQLTPIGVEEVRQQYNLPAPDDVMDPQTNVLYGTLLLQFYYRESGSIRGALTLYNGGYMAYWAWRARRPIPAETEDYVRKVINLRWQMDSMFDRILPETRNPLEKLIDETFENNFSSFGT